MIHIAIVEDQTKWTDRISSFLNRYQNETGASFCCSYYKDGNEFLSRFKGGENLVFRDVARPDRNGIDTSKELRKIDPSVCLVFLTERAQYAVEGYEVNAYDFLIKPIEYGLFKVKRDKFLAHIHKDGDPCILISGQGEARKIRMSDIRYVEQSKHYIYFHCLEDTYRRRGSIDSIRKKLKDEGFSEINRSLIVNLSYVDNYSKRDVTIGKETLPLSRVYKASFLNDLTKYFGDKE